MKITICASLKFWEKLVDLKASLEAMGHIVNMPIKAAGVDYWSKDGSKRVEVKKSEKLLHKHMKKIEDSDAILVANFTKGDIENYVGANTFLEIGFAEYLGKKIYFLNSLPNQPYISEELESIDSTVLDGDLGKIS
ncbi:MAG: hypothetical protein COU09_02905 [Candidatus Harrisonbacteria bacterium CG10_big_fil_rev_8_21_14_0_10_44_23]|uniref:Maf-like protein n=1 Tax=Candidatus Harrisonbacteria bacterium CG10_big_fil_rev_8_21_14_0_10_44_23 TaxID=1974585 RepID=A0A2H0URM3_9BACT|nr:MAG: hypothetical protein COU09_02905 [Candidatus Harrisonbacteria bacterium CG10_big_fil_rev_8_21_14_0_10_44_23]